MLKKVFLSILGTIIIIFSIVYFYPVAKIENSEPSEKEKIISKALSSIEITLLSRSFNRTIFNEIDNDTVDYKMKGVSFMGSKELIKRGNCDFYSIKTKKYGEIMYVDIYHNASGIAYQYYYIKNTFGNWEEIYSRWGYVKRELDRPKYICLEILRLTDPLYKDYDINMIPRDSIK